MRYRLVCACAIRSPSEMRDRTEMKMKMKNHGLYARIHVFGISMDDSRLGGVVRVFIVVHREEDTASVSYSFIRTTAHQIYTLNRRYLFLPYFGFLLIFHRLPFRAEEGWDSGLCVVCTQRTTGIEHHHSWFLASMCYALCAALFLSFLLVRVRLVVAVAVVVVSVVFWFH